MAGSTKYLVVGGGSGQAESVVRNDTRWSMGIRVGVKRAVAARGYGSEAVLRDVGLGRWGRRVHGLGGAVAGDVRSRLSKTWVRPTVSGFQLKVETIIAWPLLCCLCCGHWSFLIVCC